MKLRKTGLEYYLNRANLSNFSKPVYLCTSPLPLTEFFHFLILIAHHHRCNQDTEPHTPEARARQALEIREGARFSGNAAGGLKGHCPFPSFSLAFHRESGVTLVGSRICSEPKLSDI